MASEEESFNLLACREVLRSFSLSNTEMSVTKISALPVCAHHESLMHQWVTAEYAPGMAWALDAETECGPSYRGGAGPQGASHCSLSNAALGYGEGGCARKGVAET